jgi:NAD(P)-dependent dehydrogenase (short-subunit alcohol dehydrogenase family)
MAGRLSGKVAFIMGAGSIGDVPKDTDSQVCWGNGRAVAVLYAREGAKVYAVDIDQKAVEATKEIIDREGGDCLIDQADATRAAPVKAVVDACIRSFGRIDILHNNVGGSAIGGPVEMGEEIWDANMEMNLKPVFLTCKYILPIMERQGGGAIVNISSVAAICCGLGRNMVSYHTAKAGLIQFTRAVGIQYAKKGIRSNCVIPGLMHTPLVAHRLTAQYGKGDAEALIRQRDAQCPSGKMGDAWDVAYASLFLASDEARYINATEIVVDGGLTAV